ncbi:MotE family protein [Rhizobium sp. L1K21]|uniref:MotE family protein n=1 Tax=Rhizobium sp. L1K21 TaxID=2954933 RepID=UPI0020924F64|nr:MotE family protein [Rhizobium sp. L1K21]MCO6187122.1 MotE family protein [Rhizobium sp. L1K21]
MISKSGLKRAAVRSLAVAVLCPLLIQFANAQDAGGEAAPSGVSSEIEKYCSNIADAARDQRYALQRDELQKLQDDVDARIAELEQRTAEYQDWLNRRNEFLAKAEAGLVEIYKNMKADAAAGQLELVNVNIAAAIIMKLAPRQSSGVLSEMSPEKAAQITGIISSATDPNTSKDP